MNELSWNGTTGEVKDSSTYLNNGTANGGATTVACKFSNCGSFSGTNNVTLNGATSYKPASSLSISIWLKGNVHGSFARLMSTNSTANVGFDITVFPTSGYPQYDIAPNLTQTALSTPINLTDNNWHNIIGTWDGSAMSLYIDGAFISNKPVKGTIVYVQDLVIGSQGDGGNKFVGLLDDVRIYNRALTSLEATSLYNYIP